MIASLTGRVVEIAGGFCVINVGGVGYEVQIPLSAMEELTRRQDDVTLHVHLHLREDAVQLFGFLTPAEKQVFVRIIGVSGIGPKTALSLLSVLSVERFRQAVAADDHRLLATVPGIGPKTAQRLVLELKGRLSADRTGGGSPHQGGEESAMGDAVEALVALGYAAPVALRAVEGARAQDQALTTPALVRAALKRLAK